MRWAVGVALLVGFAGGATAGTSASRPVVRRGPWRVLWADLHVHTRLSDGFLSPFEVVLFARRQGLDVVGVTEHNLVWPAEIARWFSERTGGPTVIAGEEITTRSHHLIGLGLKRRVRWELSTRDAIDEIHRQGGLAIAAHPVAPFWRSYAPVIDRLDGAEVMHPIAYRSSGRGGRGWRWEQMVEFYERARRDGARLAAIGSSDYHFFDLLGICRTLVFARDDTAASVIEAIGAGRTIVYALDGRAFGDPAMLALVSRAPLPRRPLAGYRARGAFDAVSRVAGWLGLVALVALRRREGAPSP